MEVHAHSSPASGGAHTPRKKWTHYFWEFLMLFLAVFCGFFAEYQLEHKIEKDREKQFIRSLVNDLEADTTRLTEIIMTRNTRESRLDSISFLLNGDAAPRFTNDLYYYAVFVSRGISIRYVPNDGTMQQLKNAGGLRLVHSRFIADSITRYDVSVRSLVKQGDIEEVSLQEYRTIAHKFFDARIFDTMMDANNNPSPPSDNPGLFPYTMSDLHDFNYKLFTVKAFNRANRRDARKLLHQAENLIVALKKEYHLE